MQKPGKTSPDRFKFEVRVETPSEEFEIKAETSLKEFEFEVKAETSLEEFEFEVKAETSLKEFELKHFRLRVWYPPRHDGKQESYSDQELQFKSK